MLLTWIFTSHKPIFGQAFVLRLPLPHKMPKLPAAPPMSSIFSCPFSYGVGENVAVGVLGKSTRMLYFGSYLNNQSRGYNEY